MVILGDLFFHHQIIIFDKSNNQIGFVNNHRNVNIFPNISGFGPIINLLTLTAILVAVCILALRNKNYIKRSSLT